MDEPVAVLGRILRGRLGDQLVHLRLVDLDAVAGADFGQHQAEPHAALGDLAIFGRIALDLGERRLGILLVAGFVAKLLHDRFIFGFDHRGGHGEIAALGQLVEQPPLHVGAGKAVQLLLLLVAEQAAKLVEVFQAKRLGEVVVGLGFAGDLHRLDGDVEHRGFALQRSGRIILGESDLHFAAVAGFGADQLVLEAGDQPARAELDRHVLALAAFEQLAADPALEIDDREVAELRGLALWRVGPALVALDQPLQLLVDRRLAGLDRQPLELEPVDVGRGHVGQRFQANRDLGVLAGLIVVVELDLRLHRRAQLLLGQQLLHALLDGAAKRVALQRVAVHLADEVGRHLAGAEAGHPHLRRHALHFLLDHGLDVLGRDGQHERPLQSLILGLDGLDCHLS